MTRTISNPGFDAKDPAEVIIVGFDFSSLTTSPSSPAVTAARHAGATDANPGGILAGAPSISGAKIVQKIAGGVDGTEEVRRTLSAVGQQAADRALAATAEDVEEYVRG